MRIVLICGVVLLLGVRCGAVDVLPETVGDFADPAHLVFKGDSPFTDAQLRAAVQSDLVIQFAAAPSQKLSKYLSILNSRLVDGFRRAGFDQPRVDVGADAATGNVIVTMNLGRRWKCGKVIVEGAKTMPVDELIKRLTTKSSGAFFQSTVTDDTISVSSSANPDQSETVSPLWEVGEPAQFHDFHRPELADAVRRDLAAMGYLHPFLRVAVEPGDSDANLVVTLIDEGPRSVLNRIDFDALNRNSPEDVCKLLKIKPGDPIDLNRIYDMQRLLWESGRFMQHTISIERIPNDPTRVNLQVKIKEAENVPLLSEPLSDLDQALLRFQKWCSIAGDNGDDLAVRVDDPHVAADLVWAGTRGWVGRVKIAAATQPGKFADFANALGEDRDCGISLTHDLTGLYLPIAGLKWDGKINPAKMSVRLEYGPNTDGDTKRLWSFAFGGDVDSNRDDGPNMHVNRCFAPVAFLSTGFSDHKNWSLKGTTLLLKNEKVTMRVDAATGRLIDATVRLNGDGPTTTISMIVRPGALKELQESLRALPCTFPFEARKPVAAFVGFTTAVFCHSSAMVANATPQQRKRLAFVVAQLLDPRELAPLDDLCGDVFEDFLSNDGFLLPVNQDLSLPSGMYAMAATMGLRIDNRLFAQQSWPGTAGRCFCLNLVGQSDLVEAELERLYSRADTGPLACLAMSTVLSNGPSRAFARSGLERLSADAFGKDCQALFAGNSRMTAMALQLADNLRGLSDEDMQAVASQLSPNASSAFAAAVLELKSHSGAMTVEMINAALEKAWNAGIRAAVEAKLTELSKVY